MVKKIFPIMVVLSALLIMYANLNGALDGYLAVFTCALVISMSIIIVSYKIKADIMFALISVVLINFGLLFQSILGVNSSTRLNYIYYISFCLSIVAALCIVYMLHKIQYKTIRLIGALSICILYIIMIVFGRTVNGVKAWVGIGEYSFQVTEITKFISAIYWTVCLNDKNLTDKEKLIRSVVIYGLNFIFLLGISEIGTLASLTIILIILMYMFIEDIRYVVLFVTTLIVCTCIGLLTLYILSRAYENHINFFTSISDKLWSKLFFRFDLWKHPENYDEYGDGYQYAQAMKSLHLAGWLGNYKYKIFVPAGDTDYAFVSLVNNMGVLMGLVIILLYSSFFILGFKMVYLFKNIEQKISAGLILVVIVSTFLTLFGSVGFIPIAGMPLSFISYGGSNLLVTFCATFFVIFTNAMEYENVIDKIIRKIKVNNYPGKKEEEVVLCRLETEDAQ